MLFMVIERFRDNDMVPIYKLAITHKCAVDTGHGPRGKMW